MQLIDEFRASDRQLVSCHFVGDNAPITSEHHAHSLGLRAHFLGFGYGHVHVPPKTIVFPTVWE